MGLNEARAAEAVPQEGRFDDRQGALQGRLRPYCCPSCGQQIAFDSLAASCRCIDECYADAAIGAADRLRTFHS